MRTDLFDFDLPPDRIALRPAQSRATPRGSWSCGRAERRNGKTAACADLPDLLQPGDCLVVNDSKVIAARLKGRRIGRGSTEPAIEATLHKRLDGSRWKAFVKPAKKLQVGDMAALRQRGQGLLPRPARC